MNASKYIALFCMVLFSLPGSSPGLNDLSRASGPKPDNSTISETIRRLRTIKTEIDDEDVPEPAKPLLMRSKCQLRDIVDNTINQNPESTPEFLQRMVMNELAFNGIKIEKPEEVTFNQDYIDQGYTYGDIDDVYVQRPEGHPDLLAVTTTIGVCCGEDTSFYLFQNRKGKWGLIIALEANYYDQIDQAQDSFQYAISSDTVNGGFFVVAADVAPWCTSNWHTLRYRILRPSQQPYNPKVLMRGERFIFLSDQPYQIGIKDDTISLGFIDDEYLQAIDDDNYRRAVNNEPPIDPADRPDHNTIEFKVSGDKIVPLKHEVIVGKR